MKRVPTAKHPASVLLYMRPGSALPRAAKEMNLATTLRQAGHKVDSVEEVERLRGHIANGGYDFVLTDLHDAAPLAREVVSGERGPVVVPVASKADRAALRDSRETYVVVIKAGKSLSYLSALDAAMRKREGIGTRR